MCKTFCRNPKFYKNKNGVKSNLYLIGNPKCAGTFCRNPKFYRFFLIFCKIFCRKNKKKITLERPYKTKKIMKKFCIQKGTFGHIWGEISIVLKTIQYGAHSKAHSKALENGKNNENKFAS